MNARELLGPLEQQPDHYLMTDKDETETILRALRLLAAAEANDGTTPETDARVDYEIRAGISLGESAIYDIARTLEMERNGLAARVGELEPDAERYRAIRNMSNGEFHCFVSDIHDMGIDAAIDAARSKP